jgi:TRAP-type C4-dicarboxylate transport system permease small subunit
MVGELLHQTEKGIYTLSKYFSTIGACAQIIMVMVIVVDVTLRIFDIGIPGSYEIVELAMIPLIFFVIAQVQSEKKNIDMDLLYILFPKRGRAFIDFVNALCSLALFGFFTYASVLQAISNYLVHEASGVLLIPLYLFNILAGIGFGLLFLVLLVDILISLGRMVGLLGEVPREEEAAFSTTL